MPPLQQYNFYSNLSLNFGRTTLDLFRFLERRIRSLARWRNHLHFNLSCRRFNLYPVSMTFSSAVKGPIAEKIIARTRKALLSERIRQTVSTLNNIQRDIRDAVARFGAAVTPAILEESHTRFRLAFNVTFAKVRDRQRGKFARLSAAAAKEKETQQAKLVAHVLPSKVEEIKKKWVYDISSKTLTNAHLSVLQKGLAFTPTPREIPIIDTVVAVESGARQLGAESAAAVRLRASAATLLHRCVKPAANVTREENLAIKDLREDSNISIHPADKGRATVVMDKREYMSKMAAHLDDAATYEKLDADPTSVYRDRIVGVLRPLRDYIPASIYLRLSPTTTNPPLLFGQPKVHKANFPLRPIVSARNTIFTEETKELARILTPLVGKTGHHIRDSVDLVDKLGAVTIPPDFTLVSFDLVNMFTSIPQDLTLPLVEEKLMGDRDLKTRTPILVPHIMALLICDLELAYFRWDGEFYAQRRGLGMGKSTSSPLSDIFMEDFESKALRDYPTLLYRLVTSSYFGTSKLTIQLQP